jgi:hypothetical protein
MRHPAAYPNMRNPGEVRAFMHNTYDRYVHGEDRFPKARVTDPENVPRKSVAIARALVREWQVIDDDNAYFDDALVTAIDRLNGGDRPQAGKVITRAGRNAVRFAVITMPGNGQPGGQVEHGIQDTATMLEILNGVPLRMSDGRELRYTDGVLDTEPQPDAVVARQSGLASLFVANDVLPQFLAEDPELLRMNRILGEQA